MSDYTSKGNNSFKLLLAFIDKNAIMRARLFMAIIGVGAFLSIMSFLWLWLFPPSNMAVLIFLASLAVLTAAVSVIVVVIYMVLLIMTVNTGKPYIAFPSMSIVRRVLAVEDALLMELEGEDREKAKALIDYWKKTLYGGGDTQ